MVFTTHCLKNAALEAGARKAAAWLLAGLCALLLAALAPAARAAATEITQLRAEHADDGLYLSAVVHFELPAAVEDALRKGIPMFFVAEADIYRSRWYWSDARVTDAARTVRLAYQPLTGRWRVNIVPGLIASSSGLRATLNQNYDTLPEALSAIQHITRWKIAEAAEIDPEGAYTLDVNFRLDLSQLPRPFQIGVAGQREWAIAAQVKERLKLAPTTPAAPAGPAAPAAAPAEAGR